MDNISTRTTNNMQIITFQDALDSFDAYTIMEYVEKVIKNTDKDIVIIDLTTLNHISSFGAYFLVDISKISNSVNKDIYILGANKKIQEIINLLGFYNNLVFIDDITNITKIKSLFPLQIKCPSCGALLNVNKSGKIICTSCKKIIFINKEGKISENI